DFHQLMRGCRRLSNSTPEPDGFHDLLTGNEQDMFDLAAAREARREKQGYVSPAQASAFLQMARQARQPGALQPHNPIARAYFRRSEFISANRQIASVHAFMESLPVTLRG